MGVNFFFVLSGFLITILLLHEEQVEGKIHLLFFYCRRVLRIWPLYYLTLFIGFVLYPFLSGLTGNQISETASPLSYIFFLGNFNILSTGPPHSGSLRVLWSVAVEEQFYLLWPLLLIAIKRNRLWLFLAVIIASLIFRAHYVDDDGILVYHPLSLAGDFATGGLLAWVCLRHYDPGSVAIRHYKTAVTFLYLLLSIVLFFNDRIFIYPALIVMQRLILDILFALVIFDQVYVRRPLFRLSDNVWFTRWGKTSYGLYCFHVPALAATLKILSMIFPVASHAPSGALLIPVIGFSLCLVMTWLSFRFFESPFLALKKRFVTAGGGQRKIPPENRGEQNN